MDNNIPLNNNLHVKKAKLISKEINKSGTFIAFTTTAPYVLIPGVGKFCACGCGKPIHGKWIKQKSKLGKTFSCFRKPREDQQYATKACADRMRNKMRGSFDTLGSIRCKLKMTIDFDKTPYRELILYTKKNNKIKIRITPKDKNIWDKLETIQRYRSLALNKQTLTELNNNQYENIETNEREEIKIVG